MAAGLSSEVVRETARFWEARTGQHVTDEDAREAIRNTASFFDLLASWDRDARAQATEDERLAAANTAGEVRSA